MNSPYAQYPSSHGDVFNALLQGSQASNDLSHSQRLSQQSSQARDFAQRYQLQGLQNQMDAQNQRNSLLQARIDGVYGPAGNILRGLFQ